MRFRISLVSISFPLFVLFANLEGFNDGKILSFPLMLDILLMFPTWSTTKGWENGIISQKKVENSLWRNDKKLVTLLFASFLSHSDFILAIMFDVEVGVNSLIVFHVLPWSRTRVLISSVAEDDTRVLELSSKSWICSLFLCLYGKPYRDHHPFFT